jgi:hypothetical protein
MIVHITVEHEPRSRTGVTPTTVFKWDMTEEQLIKLNEYANALVEEA